MDFPAFIDALPRLDLPFPETAVSARALRSDRGLVVFFSFHQDLDIPPHQHLAQWGTLVAGEIEITIAGTPRTMRPGDTWDIPAGVAHSVRIKAGARAIDVFEEPDRYALKP